MIGLLAWFAARSAAALDGRDTREHPGAASNGPSNLAAHRQRAKRFAGARVRLGWRSGAPAFRRPAPRRCVLPAVRERDRARRPRVLVGAPSGSPRSPPPRVLSGTW